MQKITSRLEPEYGDMKNLVIKVERGKLYVKQKHNGKHSA